jgi:hypothetical protein
VQNTELRPYGAGELLDRAVTLFVRQFVPIVVLLAAVIVPLAAVQAYVSPESARVFSDLGKILTAGSPAAQRQAADAISLHQGAPGLIVGFLFVDILVRLLMWGAVVAFIASAYAGTRLTIAQAYRIGLRRWLPQVIVAFAFIVIGILVAIPLLVVYFVLILIVVATAVLKVLALTLAIAITGGLAVFAAFVVGISWVFMAYELATFSVVTETPNPIEAVGTAVRRGLARGMRWRTVVGGLVVLMVSQAGSIPLLIVGSLASAATHLDALYFAVIGAGAVLLEGLVATFVVVYAVDVRVRREGWDIIASEAPPAIA